VQGAMIIELREHLIAKAIAKYGLPKDDADIAINEFIKFIEIALCAPASFIQVVPSIDNIWHEAILQTEAYESLCNSFSPGNFLHHRSQSYEAYSEGVHEDVLLEENLSWTVNYLLRFGKFTAQTLKYWTFPNYLVQQLGWNLDEINCLDTLGLEEKMPSFQIEMRAE
jgi:hypothetical protein